jgi:hypothetical protein
MKFVNFLHDLSKATQMFDLNYDAFSKGQLESKQWLIDEYGNLPAKLGTRLGITFVLCGWYGLLPSMLLMEYGDEIDKIRSFDIDPECEKIADQINRTYLIDGWRFKAVPQDINEINFEKHSWSAWSYMKKKVTGPVIESPDTIINTSCEHTSSDWYIKVPDGKLVILQSNSSFGEEGHVNAMTSLDEMEFIYSMKKIYYKGEKEFDTYKRFMLMGVK